MTTLAMNKMHLLKIFEFSIAVSYLALINSIKANFEINLNIK